MARKRVGAPVLLVLASTYPRWRGDPEPGFVHELARRLTDRFRVMVLCPHAPNAPVREMLDGVEVVRYRYAPERFETLVNDGGIVANLQRKRWKLLLVPGFILSQAWNAWRLLRRERIHLVHAHWLLPQGLVAAALQRLPGCKDTPFVVTSHGADLYALRGRTMDILKRLVLRRAAAATVVSTAMRQSLHAAGADVGKVAVLPMGVDFSGRFTPETAVRRAEREILFVGRLVEKKGLRYLLEAMPAVLRKFPDAALTVAGFGPEETALKAYARHLALESKVRFLGAVPQQELPDLYRRAAVFVAPFVEASSGDQEGLGLVLVEAIGCGCPVVAGDIPAVHDVLGDLADAVDAKDAARLADAIMATFNDPKAASEKAARLRNALVDRMDWRSVADQYCQVLGSLAEVSGK